MKTSEIQDMIANDSELDHDRLDFESLRIPSLHAKYYRIFMDEAATLKSMSFELARMKREKMEYYLGKAPEEIYKEKPLDMKVLKTDLPMYMDGDSELHDMELKVQRLYGGKDKTMNKRVVISTWQSIYKNDASWFRPYTSYFCDEAHGADAKSISGIIDNLPHAAIRIGLTGTL